MISDIFADLEIEIEKATKEVNRYVAELPQNQDNYHFEALLAVGILASFKSIMEKYRARPGFDLPPIIKGE